MKYKYLKYKEEQGPDKHKLQVHGFLRVGREENGMRRYIGGSKDNQQFSMSSFITPDTDIITVFCYMSKYMSRNKLSAHSKCFFKHQNPYPIKYSH